MNTTRAVAMLKDMKRSRHQFSLWQLLVAVTAICVILGVAVPWLRWIGEQNEILALVIVTALSMLALLGLVIGFGVVALRANPKDSCVFAAAISHGIGALGLIAYLCIAAPAFERMFHEFEMPLAPPSVLVLRASWMILVHPFVALPLAAALLAGNFAVLALLHRSERCRWVARAWSGCITMLFGALMAFALWALVREPFGIIVNLSRTEYPF